MLFQQMKVISVGINTYVSDKNQTIVPLKHIFNVKVC